LSAGITGSTSTTSFPGDFCALSQHPNFHSNPQLILVGGLFCVARALHTEPPVTLVSFLGWVYCHSHVTDKEAVIQKS
jgi:hypothetical protein